MNWILFSLCLGVVLLQFSVVMMIHFTKKKRSVNNSCQTSEKTLSVVIPFRNEGQRIAPLIDSLNQTILSKPHLLEFIFVDDHSTDDSLNKLKKLDKPHAIISNMAYGKKSALQAGIEKAKHAYILTLDADVSFHQHYLEQVVHHLAGDMVILPVKMTGKSCLSKLAGIEFEWLQQVTFAMPHPVLCNGACLIFKREEFLLCAHQRKDQNIPSGDDLFLLDIFKKQHKIIIRQNKKELQVITQSPEKFIDLLKQRKRWMGKIKYLPNFYSLLSGVFLIAVQLVFIVSLCFTFYSLWWLLVPAVKILAEILFTQNHPFGLRMGLLFLHQFYYPIYLICLILPVSDDLRWNHSEPR